MKSRWTVYLTERFPLIPNLLIALGFTMTARELSGNRDSGLVPVFVAIFGGMTFLAQIRFMDEYKDYEKDCIAHPDRPLPRGLFTRSEFATFIRIFNAGMLGIAILSGILVGWRAGACFAIGTGYLHLMFKEFFAGQWLGARPFLYALSHQIILVPMVAFSLECFSSGAIIHPEFGALATLLLFSFFGFEVGRKLDPGAHPVLNTYLRRYGRLRTSLLLSAALGGAVLAGERIGIHVILAPLFGLVLLAQSLLWRAPAKFKWIEGLVTLFLLLSIWGVPLVRGRS
jgi:hypothetical protein